MPGRMSEVMLVEVADEPSSGAPVDPSCEAGGQPVDDVRAARTWVRTHARWLVASVVLVVGVLAGTQLVVDRREAARTAALALVPGIVPPVDATVGVLWRADPELALALRSGSLVDGLLVGGTQDASGAPAIVGLDPDTGRVAWRTPVDLSAGTTATRELWITCEPVARGESHVAACTAQQYGEGIEGVPASSVWVLDPADGAVLADSEVDGGWGLAFIDDGMVVARPAAGAAGRWEVRATDVVSGETRWSWTTPQAAGGTAVLESSEDHVVLVVDTHSWVLTTSGEPVLDVPLEPDSWLQTARAGVFVVSTWTSSAYTGTLLLADGTRVPLDETAGWLGVDDGTAPDLVLTAGQSPGGADGLTGRSARTGDRLWHVPGTIVSSLLLDGTVYVATTDALVAVDAESGEVRWTTELDRLPQQLSTDGRYLLLPGPGVVLRAYALTDGTLAWTTDLTDALREGAGTDGGTPSVQGFRSGWHDARLYVWMDTGAVAVLG